MIPAARLQAAIEIIDEILVASRTNGAAADTLITRYFKVRRYAGSKDRRAVRELVYGAIRRYGTPPATGRAALLGLTEADDELLSGFDGSRFGPAVIADGETGAPATGIPDWLRAKFSDALDDDDISSLSGRAPLDIRVNSMHVSREEASSQLVDQKTAAGLLSHRAIRLEAGFPIEKHRLWLDGLVDIQDEGSQIIADFCGIAGDMMVVDLCAGAGGKTLALYDSLSSSGRLVACDTDRGRLKRLEPRASRCRMPGIEQRLLNPGRELEVLGDLVKKADCVLVDAPCSGTGTWRRNPEARWRLTADSVDRLVKLQADILGNAAQLIAPGGFLVYAVCSLLEDEGEGQISRFLEKHSGFRKVAPAKPVGLRTDGGFLLTPARHGTDGFFFARLQRSC